MKFSLWTLLVIPTAVSFCELRKTDLLLDGPALHCNKLLAISLKILLYLSYKSNAFNISYQADNVVIAQMIVFLVLARCRVINFFQCLEIPAVYALWVTQFVSNGCIHLDMKAALRRLSSDIFKHYVLKLIQCESTVCPKFGNKTDCGSSYDCLYHSISQRKLLERGTHKKLSLLFSYYSCVLHYNFTDKQKKSCNSVKTNAFQHFKYLFIVHNKNCSLINKMCYFLEQPSVF